MSRLSRKEMKHDEFVDTSFRLLKVVEDHPRALVSIVVGLLLLVVLVTGALSIMSSRADATADLFARAQAAAAAPIALDGSPKPGHPYTPSFASAEQRTEAALERLAEAADGSGLSAELAGYLRGVTLLESGKVDEAVAQLEESVDRLGDDPTVGGGVREAYALALERVARLDEALEIWLGLAEEGSGFPRDLALFGQARVQRALGDEGDARATLEELLELYPQSPVARQARGQL